MNVRDRIVRLYKKGHGYSAIGKIVGKNPSSVYYILRTEGYTNKPLYREKKKELKEDFNLYEWQILLAIAKKASISKAEATYRITITHHREELEYFLWKMRVINSLGVIGKCTYIRNYPDHNNQLIAELASTKLGGILYTLKNEGKLPIFHLMARTIVYMDGEGAFDYSMTPKLAAIQDIEPPEPIQRGKALCWKV